MEQILNSYTLTELKKHVKTFNAENSIKGYSKMKKDELIQNMLKFKDAFKSLKMKEMKQKEAPKKEAPKKEALKQEASKKEAPEKTYDEFIKEGRNDVIRKEFEKIIEKMPPTLSKKENDIFLEKNITKRFIYYYLVMFGKNSNKLLKLIDEYNLKVKGSMDEFHMGNREDIVRKTIVEDINKNNLVDKYKEVLKQKASNQEASKKEIKEIKEQIKKLEDKPPQYIKNVINKSKQFSNVVEGGNLKEKRRVVKSLFKSTKEEDKANKYFEKIDELKKELKNIENPNKNKDDGPLRTVYKKKTGVILD